MALLWRLKFVLSLHASAEPLGMTNQWIPSSFSRLKLAHFPRKRLAPGASPMNTPSRSSDLAGNRPYPTRTHAVVIAAIWASVGLAIPAMAAGSLQIGQPAPDFTATDSRGAAVSLNQYRGKTVVLEWTNAD